MRPYVLTHYSGYRKSAMPPEIREICDRWRQASRRPEPLLLFFHSLEGRLVKTASPVVHHLIEKRLPLDDMHGQLLRDLESVAHETGADRVKLPGDSLHLPDVADGVRIYLKVAAEAKLPGNYRVPIVEAVGVTVEERRVLDYPSGSRTLDASRLSRWLEQLYPPAIMERSGKITGVGGTLTLTPRDSDPSGRCATLTGEIDLTIDDGRRSRYRGTLEVALLYETKGQSYRSLRGTYRGTYSRSEPAGLFKFVMTAAIESRPR